MGEKRYTNENSIKAFLESPKREAGELVLSFVTDETAALARLEMTILSFYAEFVKWEKLKPNDPKAALKRKQFERIFGCIKFLQLSTRGTVALSREIQQVRFALSQSVQFVESLEDEIEEMKTIIKERDKTIERMKIDIKEWEENK